MIIIMSWAGFVLSLLCTRARNSGFTRMVKSAIAAGSTRWGQSERGTSSDTVKLPAVSQ